jgi:cytochrome c2
MNHSSLLFMGGGLLALFADMAFGAGHPARGAQAFRPCMACHPVKPGEPLTGPSLQAYGTERRGL